MKFNEVAIGCVFACKNGVMQKEGDHAARHALSGLELVVSSTVSVVPLPSKKMIMESEYKEILAACKKIGLSSDNQQSVETYLKHQGIFAEHEKAESPYNALLLAAQLAAVDTSIQAIEIEYTALQKGDIYEDFSDAEVDAATVTFELILKSLNARRTQISTLMGAK